MPRKHASVTRAEEAKFDIARMIVRTLAEKGYAVNRIATLSGLSTLTVTRIHKGVAGRITDKVFSRLQDLREQAEQGTLDGPKAPRGRKPRAVPTAVPPDLVPSAADRSGEAAKGETVPAAAVPPAAATQPRRQASAVPHASADAGSDGAFLEALRREIGVTEEKLRSLKILLEFYEQSR